MSTWEHRPAVPYEQGNTKSLRHGIWSQRTVDPLVAELVAALTADRPDLLAYPEVVVAWGRAEARCLLLSEWFGQRGLFDEDGNERPGVRFVQQFERLAGDLRSRLGIDPVSEASLARERAEVARQVVDLDAIRARGRKALKGQTR